ncbi:MAG: exodeoxyribonuclease VII large subunit [Mogibacterium sp.]|nr:exodeoxyribonuclease VII large subunit [Mogibacterium sp.]MBR0380734.1 exodeoxyribonuclease VII large subunit [Mogibacterium sp.]
MKPVSVSQVNEYIAKKLRDDLNLRGLAVEGEISGLSRGGQHYYLTLKDADSQIRCAIWGSNTAKIDMSLVEDGKKVVVICDISPYARGGSYSLSIRHVEAAGEGDLAAEFRRVRDKLEKEGLFDKKYKKPIPQFPYRVGVVTSATGAAVEDIRKIITAKNDLTDIVIFPTVVQGIGAVNSICENIREANRLSASGTRIDTLIVGRGGGSAEDLAAFNDEDVARAVFASEIPVISAVGHEVDFSICDFAADARAETPTAAADMAVMDTHQLREDIEKSRQMLITSAGQKIASERRVLDTGRELLRTGMKARIAESRSEVEKALIILRENDPRSIFSKGYAAVTDGSGGIVAGIAGIRAGDEYKIMMNGGSFTAKAIEVTPEKK